MSVSIKLSLSPNQSNMLRTINRHGGTRLSTLCDSRVSKALLKRGLIENINGYYVMTQLARDNENVWKCGPAIGVRRS